MNRGVVDKIANAVLYEGYVLYPYRPSVKNKQRWTFGGIYPQSWSEAQNGAESSLMQTECLLQGSSARVHIIVRFLQLVERTVGKAEGDQFKLVDSLEIGEQRYQPWQEAVEREIDLGEFSIDELASPIEKCFSFAADKKEEILRDSDGEEAGILWRRQEAIHLSISISAMPWTGSIYILTVKMANNTPRSELAFGVQDSGFPPCPHPNPLQLNSAHRRPEYRARGQEQGAGWSRDEALLRALVSTHTILGIEGGEFISLTDPPLELKELARACNNIGAWPVLVGVEPQRDTVLSSPIILSDYPEIAAESPGDLFDGLEIDEILTLRIMTLTDEEKKSAAATDERVGQLLKRTESLARQQMMNLHGAIRGLKIVEEKP